MGSHPTLDHTELAAEARQLDPDDWTHPHAVAHLAADHPQVRTLVDDNPYLAQASTVMWWNRAVAGMSMRLATWAR
jgi:hypothetical protein